MSSFTPVLWSSVAQISLHSIYDSRRYAEKKGVEVDWSTADTIADTLPTSIFVPLIVSVLIACLGPRQLVVSNMRARNFGLRMYKDGKIVLAPTNPVYVDKFGAVGAEVDSARVFYKEVLNGTFDKYFAGQQDEAAYCETGENDMMNFVPLLVAYFVRIGQLPATYKALAAAEFAKREAAGGVAVSDADFVELSDFMKARDEFAFPCISDVMGTGEAQFSLAEWSSIGNPGSVFGFVKDISSSDGRALAFSAMLKVAGDYVGIPDLTATKIRKGWFAEQFFMFMIENPGQIDDFIKHVKGKQKWSKDSTVEAYAKATTSFVRSLQSVSICSFCF